MHFLEKKTHFPLIPFSRLFSSFKFISCFVLLLSTPVMGAQKEAYEIVGPPDSFIHIDDFSGPKDLGEHLLKLDVSDRLYNNYFKHVGTGEFKVKPTHTHIFRGCFFQPFSHTSTKGKKRLICTRTCGKR